MTKTTDPDQLVAEAEQLSTKAAERRSLAARIFGDREREREARAEAYDRARLAEYSTEAELAKVREAREAFRQAVADDPVFAAFIAYQAARIRWRYGSAEARALAERFGTTPPIEAPVPDAALSAELDAAIAQAAQALVIANQEAAAAAREAAIEGGRDGRS